MQIGQRGQRITVQHEPHLCALGESFASFAVKIFYRKGRKEKPQSSQRRTFTAEIFHVNLRVLTDEFLPPPSCGR